MGERLSPSTVDGRDTEDSRSKRNILHAPIYDEDADISHPHVGKEMEEKMLPHRQQMKGARIRYHYDGLLLRTSRLKYFPAT
ncbi:ABC transporter G family member 22 [Fusarium oxysporum f. sp. albedinis]|nr:ABC transporter G family member 22 [Fusarium oxysporum f. sp. albedinis]